MKIILTYCLLVVSLLSLKAGKTDTATMKLFIKDLVNINVSLNANGIQLNTKIEVYSNEGLVPSQSYKANSQRIDGFYFADNVQSKVFNDGNIFFIVNEPLKVINILPQSHAKEVFSNSNFKINSKSFTKDSITLKKVNKQRVYDIHLSKNQNYPGSPFENIKVVRLEYDTVNKRLSQIMYMYYSSGEGKYISYSLVKHQYSVLMKKDIKVKLSDFLVYKGGAWSPSKNYKGYQIEITNEEN